MSIEKKHILLLSFLITMLVGITYFYQFQITKLVNSVSKRNIYVSKHYNNHYYADLLKKLEQKIWSELEHYSITQQSVSLLKEKNYQDYLKVALPDQSASFSDIDPHVHNLITSTLQAFEIDPQTIYIIAYHGDSAVAANDMTILVNQERLKLFHPLAQKFAIAHEIQHIIYQDDSTNFVIEQYQKLFNDIAPHKNPLNKLSRFQELRADILASLKNKDYAEGQILFMQKSLELSGEGSGITHPTKKFRKKVGQNIVNYFNFPEKQLRIV